MVMPNQQYPQMMPMMQQEVKKKKKKKKSSSSDEGVKAARTGCAALGCCCITCIVLPIVICIIVIIIIIVAVAAAGESIESSIDAANKSNCDPKCTYLEDWSTTLDCDPGNHCQCPGASECSIFRICHKESETATCKQFGQENMWTLFDNNNKWASWLSVKTLEQFPNLWSRMEYVGSKSILFD